MPKLVVLAIAVALLCVPASASASPTSRADISACLHFTGHVYEACFAYAVNDSGLALRNYYRLAHSRNTNRAADAAEDLRYRYHGSALALILRRTASWPRGENLVAIPSITIVSASASLTTNTASLTTRETWRVSTPSGRILYQEASRLHKVKMARVQGKLLHIWVVTSLD